MAEITDTVRAEVARRAHAMVGKPYVFAADGPEAYDCSGVTKASWDGYRALPHNSGQQLEWLQSGKVPDARAVRINAKLPGLAAGQLQPGDIAFYYGQWHRPASVTHCAIYVATIRGRRWIVNATNEELGVELIYLLQYAQPIGYGFFGH